ncbi:Txe/YoeB family addiction module toxin [Pseudomonas sp. B2M1-30]|uniref:Txe/YoeB family addiction module toxin n=1 Tax=Pseudomonas koreensis TaxID=198620 RepID=A0A9X3BDS8_9PSED|nr:MULTISPECIES: Txe/YoeB family addiction module toxin [Pseudomonas]MBV4477368.1 Txe/YoeB family addiction module toxin [Pseudomonas botevensis]MCU0118562.1 Txe/YoeB family addiction module toxin [Pseudomonas sp. B2M1-30]MCU7251000.1 Txe/YoeB family addiction module toxin [Pseudomonas koreensis]MCU7263170.1 Txe/YoeB family addiction module toxin [Pseudomonas koreensis]
MNIEFTPTAWEDYLWFQQNDKTGLKRINLLIKAIQRQPFEGVGKPEPLKHNMSGLWSRRITAEHRLVYAVDGPEVCIISCKYHY